MYSKSHTFLLFLLYLCVGAISAQSKIVLETDFDGNVVAGSKAELIKEIRLGKPVWVGYQLDFDEDKVADFDHWAEAEFITILKDEVFTQIRNINVQRPNMDPPHIDIYPGNTMWTAYSGPIAYLRTDIYLKT